MTAHLPERHLTNAEVYERLSRALYARDGERLHAAAARIVSTIRHRAPVRLAAHAVLDTPMGLGREWPGLRRALRFAETDSLTRGVREALRKLGEPG